MISKYSLIVSSEVFLLTYIAILVLFVLLNLSSTCILLDFFSLNKNSQICFAASGSSNSQYFFIKSSYFSTPTLLIACTSSFAVYTFSKGKSL